MLTCGLAAAMYIAHETSLRLTLGAGGPRPLNFYKQKKSPSSRRAFEEQIHFFYSIFGHVSSGAFYCVCAACCCARRVSLSLPIIIVYTYICTQKASPAAGIKQAPFEVNALMIQFIIYMIAVQQHFVKSHLPNKSTLPRKWFAEAPISFVLPSWLFELEFWYQRRSSLAGYTHHTDSCSA